MSQVLTVHHLGYIIMSSVITSEPVQQIPKGVVLEPIYVLNYFPTAVTGI